MPSFISIDEPCTKQKRSGVLEAEQILLDLLDNPSFNRWIKGEADTIEQQKWEKWQEEIPMHAEVRKMAQRLYELPLEETQGDDLQRELKKLRDRMDGGSSALDEGSKFDERREISDGYQDGEHKEVFQLPGQPRQNSAGYRWAVAAGIVLLTAAISVIALYTLRQPKEA